MEDYEDSNWFMDAQSDVDRWEEEQVARDAALERVEEELRAEEEVAADMARTARRIAADALRAAAGELLDKARRIEEEEGL